MNGPIRHRTLKPAVPEWVDRGWLTIAWLQNYADDVRFQRHLASFFQENIDDIRTLARMFAEQHVRAIYFHWIAERAFRDHRLDEETIFTRHEAAMRSFCKRWHLHILPRGIELIGGWTFRHLQHSEWYPVEQFHIGTIGFGGAMGFVWPDIRVDVSTFWKIEEETETEVRRRLLQLCEAEIDTVMARLRDEAKNAGYVFPPVQPTEGTRHLHWLYRHMVHGESFAKIAVSENGMNEEVIRKRIAEYRRRLRLLSGGTSEE